MRLLIDSRASVVLETSPGGTSIGISEGASTQAMLERLQPFRSRAEQHRAEQLESIFTMIGEMLLQRGFASLACRIDLAGDGPRSCEVGIRALPEGRFDVTFGEATFADDVEGLDRLADQWDRIGVGFWVTDAELRIRRVNFSLTQMLGRAEQEILGATVASLLDGADAPRFEAATQMLCAGVTAPHEHALALGDATSRRVAVIARPMFHATSEQFVGSTAAVVELGLASGQDVEAKFLRETLSQIVDLSSRMLGQLTPAAPSATRAAPPAARGALQRNEERARDCASPGPHGRIAAAAAKLTEREREVYAHVAIGEKAGTIADALGLSEHTVRNHLKSIFRKLGVGSQLEIVRAHLCCLPPLP